jgi:hypothetical protein
MIATIFAPVLDPAPTQPRETRLAKRALRGLYRAVSYPVGVAFILAWYGLPALARAAESRFRHLAPART